ncbi:hypothetical protein [Streptomyces sp. H27-D2]|uniref:hypothetical protein n=1 Tax=Streptomyces sp. H27-D2 TaxID=3046304 RepID=UPI002DBF4266|nr:hypothetical protein [Streptomyces sp. H27-D2]MEC4016442.1 hypothetical protein [Streptomyces sp. H27-D2]
MGRVPRRVARRAQHEREAEHGGGEAGADSPAGRRLSETLAFFEFLDKELEGVMERWRVHREQVFPD